MTSSIYAGGSRKIDRKNNLLKNNCIPFRYRRRRPEVTSQCDRIGNESRRPIEMAKATAAAERILRRRGFRRVCGLPLCRERHRRTSARLANCSASLVEKISEKNSSLRPHPVPALFLFSSLSDKPKLILGLQDIASIGVCLGNIFGYVDNIFSVQKLMKPLIWCIILYPNC